MSLYKQYATDSKAETEGVEIKMFDAENEDGSVPTFIISRMGKANREYSKAMEAATRPFRRQIELGTLSNEKAEEMFMDVFASTIVKGWSNVFDRFGDPLPYSTQAARKLFTELPELYDRLQEEAKTVANFRETAREEEAKN